MKIYTNICLSILLITLSLINVETSLINNFFEGAKNLWPRAREISSLHKFNELPQLHFEIPKENEDFLKEGLEIINAPKNSLDLCTHKVVIMLKKNCNQLGLEEIGKLAVMLMNCQLETEGRSLYPCKPEMTLAQCTMGFDNTINNLYHFHTQRALSICSAIKQQQMQMFTEMAVNKLMQVTQKQTGFINEALQNQKRVNEMGIQNIQEYSDNFEKIKETQIQNMESLISAKDQIIELNNDLQRQLEIHQISEQKLMKIEKSADEVARNLENTNVKIVQHYNEAIKFMEHFKNIMEMINIVTSTIERLFERTNEIMKEIGIEISQDSALALIINLIYFICGMIFILFVNLQPKYKRILIILFLFNILAALYQADISLLSINILVWVSQICFYAMRKLKEKLFSMNNFDILEYIRMRRNSNEIVRRSKSRSRSSTPLSKQKKLSTKNAAKKSAVFEKVDESDEDSEIADLCEQEMMKIQQNIPKLPPPIPPRPETPANRPMTPAMLRVMQTSGVDVSNRAATPFQPGLSGRVQCQATTNKGTQCRNAALIGYDKCKVHNYT